MEGYKGFTHPVLLQQRINLWFGYCRRSEHRTAGSNRDEISELGSLSSLLRFVIALVFKISTKERCAKFDSLCTVGAVYSLIDFARLSTGGAVYCLIYFTKIIYRWCRVYSLIYFTKIIYRLCSVQFNLFY